MASSKQVCQGLATLSVRLAKDLGMQHVLQLLLPTLITMMPCHVTSHTRLSAFFRVTAKKNPGKPGDEATGQLAYSLAGIKLPSM